MEKTNQKTIRKIIKDYIIPWQIITIISIILFATDFTQGRPFYIMVLDLGDEVGTALALGMATLFAVLPKIKAKLIIKEHYKLATLAFVLAVGLLSFIYIGQAEVVRQEANGPLKMLLTDPLLPEDESESNRHFISTGLIALLYCFSTFISYLYYSDVAREKPLKIRMLLSNLGRSIRLVIVPLKKRSQRAAAQPAITAESRVKDYMESLKSRERELERSLVRQESSLNYELAVLDNARASVEAAIQSAYKH